MFYSVVKINGLWMLFPYPILHQEIDMHVHSVCLKRIGPRGGSCCLYRLMHLSGNYNTCSSDLFSLAKQLCTFPCVELLGKIRQSPFAAATDRPLIMQSVPVRVAEPPTDSSQNKMKKWSIKSGCFRAERDTFIGNINRS